ncbi:MAG: P-II family nitrogen regulator [Elusimicrobia bacterium]|jgi:nitrogen regulatory protein P-II 2|nr:P-II family nitrogen regulator [Elusimicrobiota bacterium]MBK7206911.1 P-II family nitrogen regulator [Elusimicrobiota bacterium]MBK7545731.1 P-II family nitrogen regulator [Elusimicrobiota bacterium]MBK7574994.1 P-II family nitrogen regulator [Elusimicrobiota bacterium]MBK7687739.1 P-II family nitrogen regulator [Elusimicrobiota bacterium]
MKLIIAMVQPHKVAEVKKALDDANIHLMTVTNVLGSGRQKGYTESFRGAKMEVNLLKKVRFDIAVNDDFVEPAIGAITKAARSGNIGDGKIFVVPLEQCVRIRTGEKGSAAIG